MRPEVCYKIDCWKTEQVETVAEEVVVWWNILDSPSIWWMSVVVCRGPWLLRERGLPLAPSFTATKNGQPFFSSSFIFFSLRMRHPPQHSNKGKSPHPLIFISDSNNHRTSVFFVRYSRMHCRAHWSVDHIWSPSGIHICLIFHRKCFFKSIFWLISAGYPITYCNS